mgnify:CR=1 FL=1
MGRIANVAPLVGAWIEISQTDEVWSATPVAPLVGAWIEIYNGNPPVGLMYPSLLL